MRLAKRIGLVGMFVAGLTLLLTAGKVVLEAHRRDRCTKNLKSIYVAVRNFHDQFECFPSGSLPNHASDEQFMDFLSGVYPPANAPEEVLPLDKRMGWFVGCLPYFGINDAGLRVDPTSPWDIGKNRVLATTLLLEELQCPASQDNTDSQGLVRTNYVGIAGVGRDAPTLPLLDPRVGVFGYERRTNLNDIKDGTATTMMVVESKATVDSWVTAGTATVRGLDPSQPPYVGKNAQFGGLHRGGALVLFADGSVRFINESVSPRIFEALATIAGGEKIELSVQDASTRVSPALESATVKQTSVLP